MNRMRRLCAAVLFVPLPLCAATAGPMMPAGRSPEVGFAGVWRVIEAATAPWAQPRDLGRKDAPLLEYAVDFADGAVKGPPPQSCQQAKYSTGVTYRDEAFGGRLASAPDQTWQKLNLTNPQMTTFRVYCGDAARDYFFDDHADVVTWDGDVIYTLERPTGMDPQQYHAGYSGPGFDCGKAEETGARLVCRDAALSNADRKLNQLYAALERTRRFETLRTDQRAWLAVMAKRCNADGPMPAMAGDKNVIIDCLSGEYDDRIATLTCFLRTPRRWRSCQQGEERR